MIALAASICAGYSKTPTHHPTETLVTSPGGENTLKVNGIVDCIRKGNVKCYFLKEPEKIQGLLTLLEDKQ